MIKTTQFPPEHPKQKIELKFREMNKTQLIREFERAINKEKPTLHTQGKLVSRENA